MPTRSRWKTWSGRGRERECTPVTRLRLGVTGRPLPAFDAAPTSTHGEAERTKELEGSSFQREAKLGPQWHRGRGKM